MANLLVYVALALGVFAAVIYGVAAFRATQKMPLLSDVIVVFISAAAFPTAFKFFGFVFSGEFEKTVAAQPPGGMFSLGAGDMVTLCISGLALCWISVESLVRCFTSLKA